MGKTPVYVDLSSATRLCKSSSSFRSHHIAVIGIDDDALSASMPLTLLVRQDQWKKKKQTKAEAKAAKRNKLDPDSELNRNAKEVMDERARNKRKLQDMQDDDEESQEDADDTDLDLDVEKEKPGEGLKKKAADTEAEEKASKKVKLAETDGNDEELSKKEKERAEKKLAKKQKKEEKKQSKKTASEVAPEVEEEAPSKAEEVPAQPKDKESKRTKKSKDVVQPTTEQADAVPSDAEMEDISVPGLADEDDASAAASTPHSPVFDTNKPSAEAEASTTASSLNSAVAPSEKPKHIQIPSDTTALRARLAARIEALRAARKADKEDGTPIRTRQELIEARREKQAQRKAHKKELRLKAKAEEDAKREEALASARNSPHLLSSPLVGLDNVETNFAFGRVAFQDGTTLSRDLTYEKEGGPQKKKMDPKSALAKLEAQKKRLAELDPEKQKEILEKETWLAARKRAEGEKVRDDEGLLKKAVKRKDKAKKKSEKEWGERKAGVQKGIRERALKREANLKERAAGKGVKGKKKSGPTKKKAGRPGFEGAGFGKK